MDFKNRVLIIGYGAVSKCTLPILLRHVNIPLENITIVDFKEKSPELKAYTTRGLRFLKRKITENLGAILSDALSEGGLLIDLAWNIDCGDIVQWCHEHNVLYVNTSVEAWDPLGERYTASPVEKSLYYPADENAGDYPGLERFYHLCSRSRGKPGPYLAHDKTGSCRYRPQDD